MSYGITISSKGIEKNPPSEKLLKQFQELHEAAAKEKITFIAQMGTALALSGRNDEILQNLCRIVYHLKSAILPKYILEAIKATLETELAQDISLYKQNR